MSSVASMTGRIGNLLLSRASLTSWLYSAFILPLLPYRPRTVSAQWTWIGVYPAVVISMILQPTALANVSVKMILPPHWRSFLSKTLHLYPMTIKSCSTNPNPSPHKVSFTRVAPPVPLRPTRPPFPPPSFCDFPSPFRNLIVSHEFRATLQAIGRHCV